MNRFILGIGCWLLGVSLSVAASPLGGGREGAPRHDWEDQSILQINREPARADFHHAGEISLNGEWKFNWTLTPDEQPDGFWQPDFNDSSWKTFPVPADWEMNGYGTPIYSSSGYTFKINPPYVMTTPKEKYTAYVERNPTAQSLIGLSTAGIVVAVQEPKELSADTVAGTLSQLHLFHQDGRLGFFAIARFRMIP